jgi:L-amino acid N-acyltransferase YncA
MPDESEVRPVQEGDAAAISAIYAHHVRHGTASFDEEALSETETRAKIRRISGHGWPFLVAEGDGTVAGYAYATQFRDRAAYAFTCENSIYVHPDRARRGVGRRLLTRLIAEAEAYGFRQMIAVIGGGEPASVALHRSLGFVEAGRMRSVGRKLGRWLDTVYMQRALGPGDTSEPAPPSDRKV